MADGSSMPGGTVSDVAALYIDPAVTTTVYAAANSRVAKSIDSGATLGLAGSASWIAMSPTAVYSLAKHPSLGYLYAGGTQGLLHYSGNYYEYHGRVFMSQDGGANWGTFSVPASYVYSLVINPAAPMTLYAGTSAGIFKSISGGGSWVTASSGLTNLSVRALAIDPTTPETLYAGTPGGVFKSIDGGTNWTDVNSGLTNLTVVSLVIDPATPATLYAGTGGGVFKSTNGGISWTAVNAGLTDTVVTSLTIASAAPATLYAGTNGGYVFKTPLPSESRLQGLVLDAGSGAVALSPAFGTNTVNYTTTVQSASVTLTPTVWNNDATVTVNGTPVASGSASVALPLDVGSNTLNVMVTSGDATSTSTYTVTVTRQVIAPAAPTDVQAMLGVPGSGQATVSWTPSASSGSSALVDYTVSGGSGCATSAGGSSCVVSGLVEGTAYTFTVTATNAEGGTATSLPSNSVTPPASCSFNGTPVLHGGSVTAFLSSTVPFGSACQQQSRTCSNGMLSGSYLHDACTVDAPASCSFNGQPVAHGLSVTAYLNAAEPAGGSCTAESRSCSNGALSGSHTHAACQVAPGAPTGVQATPTGSGQVAVTWQAPADVGSGITGYVATSQPDGHTCVPTPPTALACTFTGLTDGTAYTFTVTASNGAGGTTSPTPSNPATPQGTQTISFGPLADAGFGTTPTLTATASPSGLAVEFASSTTGVCTIDSNGVLTFLSIGTCTITATQPGSPAWQAATPVLHSFEVLPVVPGTPTAITATAGNAQATVGWAAPASDGGSPITGYLVEVDGDSSKSCAPATPSGTQCTVTGLANGTAYTFKVFAINLAGPSAAATSPSATPQAPAVPNPPTPPTPQPPTTGNITVPPTGSGSLTGPGNATLGAGSTLTVQPGAAGSPITPPASGSATVVLGSTGGSVTLGGTGQAVVLAPAPGQTAPALGLGSGTVTVGSNTPGQPLLDVGPAGTSSGQQAVAGPNGGSLQAQRDSAGGLTVQVTSGSVGIPCGLPCKGVPSPMPPATMTLQVGEQAQIDAQGVVQQVLVAVPTVPPPANAGLTLPASMPVLTGEPPARTPGETLLQQAQQALQTALQTSLASQGQQPAGQATWIMDGLTLGLLPLGLPTVDLTAQDGARFLPDGSLRIVRLGVVQTFGPAPLGLDVALQALRAIAPTAQISVLDAGAWRINGLGVPLVVRPQWLGSGTPTQGPGRIDVDDAGQVWLVSGNGSGSLRVPLNPAMAEPQTLADLLRAADAQANLQVLLDGTGQALLGGQGYVLLPWPGLERAPAERAVQGVWVTVEQGRLLLRMRLADGWVQVLEVR